MKTYTITSVLHKLWNDKLLVFRTFANSEAGKNILSIVSLGNNNIALSVDLACVGLPEQKVLIPFRTHAKEQPPFSVLAAVGRIRSELK